MSDPYAAIRPFNDDEVRPVIERLLRHDEFIAALSRLRFGSSASYLGWLQRPLLRAVLGRRLRAVKSVHDVQMVIKQYVEFLKQR